MPTHNIFFFKEGIKFRLNDKESLVKWIAGQTRKAGFGISNVNFIFCSDVYLRRMNVKYLKHDYFTDIITFDNSSEKKILEGDIYISIDRVKKNSALFKSSFNDELHRVMCHGMLHLMGYDDSNKRLKEVMRKMEDRWLGFLNR